MCRSKNDGTGVRTTAYTALESNICVFVWFKELIIQLNHWENVEPNNIVYLSCFSGDRCVQQGVHPTGNPVWPPARRHLHQRQRTKTGQQKILLEGKRNISTYKCTTGAHKPPIHWHLDTLIRGNLKARREKGDWEPLSSAYHEEKETLVAEIQKFHTQSASVRQ